MPDEHEMAWALRLLSQHGDMLQQVIEALNWRKKSKVIDNAESAMRQLLALSDVDMGDPDQSEQILADLAARLETRRVESDAVRELTTAFSPEMAELVLDAVKHPERVDIDEFDRIVDKLAGMAKAGRRELNTKQSDETKVTREEISQVAKGLAVNSSVVKSIVTRLDTVLQRGDLRSLLVRENQPLPMKDRDGAYVREHLRGVLAVISLPHSSSIHGLGKGSATRKLLEALVGEK